ncbi:hypothetical protein FLAN108750_04375 [Flavobacterium antarcticum]
MGKVSTLTAFVALVSIAVVFFLVVFYLAGRFFKRK